MSTFFMLRQEVILKKIVRSYLQCLLDNSESNVLVYDNGNTCNEAVVDGEEPH